VQKIPEMAEEPTAERLGLEQTATSQSSESELDLELSEEEVMRSLFNNTVDGLEVPKNVSQLLCPLRKKQMVSHIAPVASAMRVHFERSRAQLAADSESSGSVRCAVVSNSGVLLKHHYGEEIDAADLVIRFNDAQVGGDVKEAVGSRDDIRVLNHIEGSKAVKDPGSLNNQTLYILMRIHMEEVEAASSVSASSDAHLVLIPNRKQMDDASREAVMKSIPNGTSIQGFLTTGFYGLVLAMSACDEVRAYGFADTDASSDAPFHYYGALKTGSARSNPEPVHRNASREKDFWNMVAVNGDVNYTDVTIIPGFSRLGCAKLDLHKKSAKKKKRMSADARASAAPLSQMVALSVLFALARVS